MRGFIVLVLLVASFSGICNVYADSAAPENNDSYYAVQVPVTKDGKIKATMYIKKEHAKEVHTKVVNSKSEVASFWKDISGIAGTFGQ